MKSSKFKTGIRTWGLIHPFENKLSGEKYKRCNTMELCPEDGTSKFVTGFRFLIFKIFSFQDN